ncbi:MAG: US12 family protein [Deltaproteobacteria bacterium]|jgi:hypothetical protein|nr:US12 family protein [Deltaproteobacteria bacterium]MBP6834180.1 US12 family protein [Deltaproteobacteria bacterium]
MVDGGALPAWGLGELAREFAPPPAGVALVASASTAGALAGVALSTVVHVGEIAAVGVYWASLVAVAALLLRYGPEPDQRTAASPRFNARAVPWLFLFAATVIPFFGSLALGATTVLAFGVIGAVACSALAVALSARRATPDPDAAAFEGLAPCASGDAPEGRVRLVGRVRVVTPTVTVEGLPCAAWEASTRAGGAVSVRSAGGVFELDDGGVRVVVQGRWVRVLGGGRRGDAVTVDEGAQVELVGDARWRSDDGAQGGFREARRVLEITGTEDRPVVLRRLAAPVRGTTGVRVASHAEEDRDATAVAERRPEEVARKR